jgi:hypothetical protein
VEQAGQDEFGIVPVDPAKALRSTGVPPLLVKSRNRRDECRAVVNIIRKLLRHSGEADPRFAQPLQPGDIGILYRYLPKNDRPLFEELRGAASWAASRGLVRAPAQIVTIPIRMTMTNTVA